MLTMSVPAQQKPNGKRTGKRITFFTDQTMKEAPQHPDGVFYVPSGAPSDQSETASAVTSNPEGPHVFLNSVIFSPDKGDQNRGHYQQTVPMKWAHQEPSQQQPSLSQQQRATTWATMPNWGQSFANYLGGLNVNDARTQNAFVKSMHESSGLQASNRAAEKPAADAYRDAAKPRSLEWEQPSFQETLKPGALNTQQQQGGPHPGGSSVLQPFQLAFGQPKQHLPSYYQTFQGPRAALPNPPNYPAQNAVPSHRLEQLQKQKQMQRQQQHVIQQQLQHHQQMQQQQIMQQQQLQQQQQQLQHEQQQQKIQQRQQLQIQQQMQHQQLQQQNPHVLDFYSGAQNAHPELQPVVVHSQESSAPAAPKPQEPIIQDITPEPQQPSHPPQHPLQPDLPSLQSQSQPRRSRRLSKEGGAPSDNPFLPAVSEQSKPENGALQAAPTGVIQSTRRKRRMSQEVNLEMLAQEASDRKPPLLEKESHRPWSPANTEGMNTKCPRDDNLLPLVIPVSVPVLKQEPSSPGQNEAALAPNWTLGPANPQDLGRRDHKPSVIVTRRRSLRNSLSEGSEPNDGLEGEKDDDGKKSKRRPRPDPLFIPPPKTHRSARLFQHHLIPKSPALPGPPHRQPRHNAPLHSRRRSSALSAKAQASTSPRSCRPWQRAAPACRRLQPQSRPRAACCVPTAVTSHRRSCLP
ncbi:ELM2 and SANT domain-containing protein 1 [Oryzias melastigma]|uniref:ELM2 and SANT domain-containing protein 1 n=1 Tax=Oryzias melastigma TaxID=30732 RepID=A0A834CHT3_ORYME|nr:ELM2 and SANT domain-containing protein 1 [Oryzias melastigma]